MNISEQLAHLHTRPLPGSTANMPGFLTSAPSPHGARFRRLRRRTPLWRSHRNSPRQALRNREALPAPPALWQLRNLRSDRASPTTFSTRFPRGAIPNAHPTTWAFLDTETTGLAGGCGTCAFLIGVGSIDREGFRVRQFFMRDYCEEPSVLHALTALSRPFRGADHIQRQELRSAAARNAIHDVPHVS